MNYFLQFLCTSESYTVFAYCRDKLPTNQNFILTSVGRMQTSSTLHVEAPHLCNSNHLSVSLLLIPS